MARQDRNFGGCVPAALLTAPSYFFTLRSALFSFLVTRASLEKKPAMLSAGREAAGQPTSCTGRLGLANGLEDESHNRSTLKLKAATL
jgi:hypothetical protein